MFNGIRVLINFLKSSELLDRLIQTVYYVLIFRLGTYIVLPGVDEIAINSGRGGLLGLLDSFVGGAFARKSIFSLGVMPYISASIIVHMLTLLFPGFHRIHMDGEAGRMRIAQITKYLTLLISVFQGIAFFSSNVTPSELLISKRLFIVISVFVLTAGAMVCVWLGEKITDNGIGQGTSLLILIGIVSSLPSAIYNEYVLKKGDMLILFLEYVVLFLVIAFTISLSLAVRKVKLVYVREIMEYDELSKRRQYLPLKLISAGVMPIIFANVMVIFIGFLFSLLVNKSTIALNIYSSLKDPLSLGYNITFSILVILFTYLYTSININSVKIANDLKSSSCFIPGVKPGLKTAEYIDSVLDLIMFPGSLCLAFIAFLPVLAYYFDVGMQLSHFYGGTSLLIAVPLAIEIWKQVKTYWLLYKYDNLDSLDN